MAEVFQEGAAKIVVQQAFLVAQIDRVTDGAASSFLAEARRRLAIVQGGAEDGWPVRTGHSKRSFFLRDLVTEDAVGVQLVNSAQTRGRAYAARIRWSVRTRESLEAEVARAAGRGTEAGKQALIASFYRRKLWRSHGAGAPSAELAGKQPWRVLVRRPAEGEQAVGLIDACRAAMARLAAEV